MIVFVLVIVITVVQVARFPLASVALQVILVVPTLSVLPAKVVFAALKAATVAPLKL